MISAIQFSPIPDTPRTSFQFALPEEMKWQLNHLRIGWWKQQYREAVIAFRKTEVELSQRRSLHQKSLQREVELKKQIEELQGLLRQREQELFGRKTEKKSSGGSESLPAVVSSPRKRGQQPGNAAPKRRDHKHLPTVEKVHELPEEQRCCPTCQLPLESIGTFGESEILEIEVKAHRRVIRRTRYHRTCQCPGPPVFVTAPPALKLIPKSHLGTSIWVEALLSKFAYGQPTQRFIQAMNSSGLFLSEATLTEGFQHLLPLLWPLYEALGQQQMLQTHWHADETRWLIFEKTPGKNSSRWYLWGIRSACGVFFILDPSRSAEVMRAFFEDKPQGLLSVDRYSAYKALLKDFPLLLAFCWAHVRRDCLKIAASFPDLQDWALQWVSKIAELYHLNSQRLAFEPQSLEFQQQDFQLRKALQLMEKQAQTQLEDSSLSKPQTKVLTSLQNHWSGLTLFVQYPHLPMDNNPIERDLRLPVTGRKAFYGSHSFLMGLLAAVSYSLIQTYRFYQLDPKPCFSEYFNQCAQHGGTVPPHYLQFLPWNMSEDQKNRWRLPSSEQNSS